MRLVVQLSPSAPLTAATRTPRPHTHTQNTPTQPRRYFGREYGTSLSYASTNAIADLPEKEVEYEKALAAARSDGGSGGAGGGVGGGSGGGGGGGGGSGSEDAPATPRFSLRPTIVAIARLDPGTAEEQAAGRGVLDFGWALVAKQEKLVVLRYLLVNF